MHGAALRAVAKLPGGASLGIVDFGAGPATALLALVESRPGRVEYMALEPAAGMQSVAAIAFATVGERLRLREVSSALNADCFRTAQGMILRCSYTVLVFSYFFAQRIDQALVDEIVRFAEFCRRRGPVIVVYTNPIGPSASWMPNEDIHFWYAQFCAQLEHRVRIAEAAYSYRIVANLDDEMERHGSCAYEVWTL